MDHNKLWKILKEMGIPDHLTCLLQNLYAGQEEQLELDMEQWTASKLGKEYLKAILSPCLFNLYTEYIMKNVGLVKHKLESRLQGETSIMSDMQVTSPLW